MRERERARAKYELAFRLWNPLKFRIMRMWKLSNQLYVGDDEIDIKKNI